MAMRGIVRIVYRRNTQSLLFQHEGNNKLHDQPKLVEGHLYLPHALLFSSILQFGPRNSGVFHSGPSRSFNSSSSPMFHYSVEFINGVQKRFKSSYMKSKPRKKRLNRSYSKFQHRGQRRTMSIMQLQDTSDPRCLSFFPGKPVMTNAYLDFPDASCAHNSPLAVSLFAIKGVERVFYGPGFVTVSKSEVQSWDHIKHEVEATIEKFFSSETNLFLDPQSLNTSIHKMDFYNSGSSNEEMSELIAYLRGRLSFFKIWNYFSRY